MLKVSEIYRVIIKFDRFFGESEAIIKLIRLYKVIDKVIDIVDNKFSFPGWRRSHRPSLRDISIIDEEEERDDFDPEIRPDQKTINNTLKNAHSTGNLTQLPAFTITK